LLGRILWTERVNWLCEPPSEPFTCRSKIRYLHCAALSTVTPLPGNSARVEFVEPQSAITPGQAVVFYDGDRVLGGGTICSLDRAEDRASVGRQSHGN
jgi:tRNA-specific 2-thiouridylase